MNFEQSIHDLEVISEALSNLKIRHAFVGGATIAVHLSAQGLTESRPTDDIDCVIDSPSLSGHYAVEDALRKAGFKNEINGPRCRWNYKGIVVDIMATDEKISGMRSRWFKEGLQTCETQALPSGRQIHIFAVPYLLATKLEAFKDRGRKDIRMSTDIEDILILLDGYPAIFEKIKNSDSGIREYLQAEFKTLLEDREFEEIVYGQLAGIDRQRRADRVLQSLRALTHTMAVKQ